MPNVRVSVEGKRGCGYRKEGGLYLVLDKFEGHPCGKLPLPLEKCPCCGNGIKFSRSFQWINAKLLFQDVPCMLRECPPGVCILSMPPEKMGLLWIGEQFYKTPEDWINEGQKMGISRRIKGIPHGFEIGKTWVAVAHIKAIEKDGKMIPAIFQVFHPSKIEYVVKFIDQDKWSIQDIDDYKEELKKIQERGIELVKVVRMEEKKVNDQQPDLPFPAEEEVE